MPTVPAIRFQNKGPQLSRIFIGLAALNTLALALTFGLGFRTDSRAALAAGQTSVAAGSEAFAVHFFCGMVSGVLTLLVHSIIFTYFIGTGRWLKETVKAYGLADSIVRQTRRFKARTSPVALFSMLLVIAAAVMGAAADTGRIATTWHLVGGVVAIGFNLMSYPVEYRCVCENMSLLDQVTAEVRSIRRARGLDV